MKKLISISVILVVICFTACDRVKNPIVKKDVLVGSNFVTKNNILYSNSKKTLLEDYTGAQCLNCPAAAVVAGNLATTYSPNLIVVAVHAGSFAKPYATYTADYRTDAGDIWTGSTGFNIQANPNGMVNRTNYASNGLVNTQTKWTTTSALAQSDPFVVKLDVTTNYDTIIGALNTDVTAIFKTAYPDPIKISIIVTEDGIIGKQKDGATEIEEYEFEHVMRGAVNYEWGENLTLGAKAANDTVKYSYPNFNLKGMVYHCKSPLQDKPIVVNDKNISVVVFVYKASTKEVLQVEKVKIR